MISPLIALACVLVLAAPLFAGNEVLAITPTDVRRHMYAEFRNGCNNSYLHVVIGEFALHRGTIRTPLLIDLTNNRPEAANGALEIDTLQTDRFRTHYFIPRKDDVLTMFRQVHVEPMQDRTQTTEEVPDASIGPYPQNWQSIVGDVVDTTTVIVRIERVADTTDFVDIDSVVTYPNPNSAFVAHAGTDPELYEHTCAIPQRYFGVSVRIRIVAKRRGMGRYQFTSDFMLGVPAYSAWRCPWAKSKIDSSEVEALYERLKVLKTSFEEMCKQLPAYVRVERHELPRDTFSISIAHSHVCAGVIDVSLYVPHPVNELAWYVYDVTGTLLNSGLIWERIDHFGWIYLPYLPLTHDAYVVKLEDTATGLADIREIRKQ